MEVVVQNRQKRHRVRTAEIRETAEKILSDLGCHGCELSIVLVDDEEITHLNLAYLARDHPTNVLAFPMREGQDKHLHPDLLGDVIISTETAEREAQHRGVILQEEMTLLLVHGILHLLGYEHEEDSDKAALMEAKEQEILNRLGFGG